MQGDAHHAAALRPLLVELVELVFADLGEVVPLIVSPEERGIVELQRIGDGDQLSRPHLDRHRLVVVHPVGVIDEARLGHQVGGVHRPGDRRPQHPLQLLAGMSLQGVYGVPVELPLLVLGVGVEVAGVVDTVAHEVPVPLHHRVADLWEVIEDPHVEGHATLDLVFVEHLHHAPEAHPVAVVAIGVLLDVGVRRPGPGVPRLVVGGQVLVVLDVRGYPEGNAGVAGPLDNRTVDDGAIVYSVGRQRHGRVLPGSWAWFIGLRRRSGRL